MAGFCGILGGATHDTDPLRSELGWTGREVSEGFTDRGIEIADVHRPDDTGRPVETAGGALVWVWGTVFGYDAANQGYGSRPPGTETTRYCADRYERDGIDFVGGLNGHFFGIVFDPDERTVSLFTDRLGVVDAYYARPADDKLVFSSALQAIERWPGTDWGFDVDYLSEFFSYTRSMGVKTPLAGVERFPPAAVITLDLDTMEQRVDRYWTPRHRPVDAPFSSFVDEFVDRFRASLADRTADAGEYGLLLSGGSDSRLVAAALEDTEQATAYHMADWMSREARIAERVALTAGIDFEFLRRDVADLRAELQRNAELCSFQGRFDQAHAEEFMGTIRTEVDYLVDGLYADILFKGWGIPRRELSLGPLGVVTLPLARPVDSVDDYFDAWTTAVPQYVRSSRSMRDILEANIYTDGQHVNHHEVDLPSPVELMVWSHVFPQTNMGGGFQIRSIRQHLPYRNPFLDNRLLDLSLSMPLDYLVRRDLISAAVERLAPELAAIPHPDSGTPLHYPFPLDWVSTYTKSFWRKFVRDDDPPRPDLGHGQWQPHSELIRLHDFVGETIADHEETIRALPFLDLDGVRECYREHRQGADHEQELYTLVTFLEMPLTQRIARDTRQEV